MQQEYSLQEKNVYKMIVCKKRILYSLQDNSLQEKNTVQLQEYNYSLQDDSLQENSMDTVYKSMKCNFVNLNRI